ncbi:beta-lactamase family protein [Bradyrhizobium sp. WSM 1704]|uniref:serine hydrolase domain-containing protein n=1 Tax=Bradyrhizobium semiaridum TaxID=2821404 RepID=UPI0035DE7EEB|nr:beta-lactamase family protein [Bradyrhizobium semiaridum]
MSRRYDRAIPIAARASRAVVTACLALIAMTAARAADIPPPSPEKLERITALFNDEVNSGRLPGAVILIQQHGKPVYLKTFGYRDVTTKAPMTVDTIFALHSMTKPITSVAAMMLVDEGKLSPQDPLSKYIPAFADVKVGIEPRNDNDISDLKLEMPVRPITIQDIMRHTSGITYEYIGADWIQKLYHQGHLFDGKFDNKEFVARLAKLPLSRQPGTLWRYGHSTDVLGRVIEVITGKTLYQFEKERIFDPMRLKDTKFVLDSDGERARMAEPLPSDTILVTAERDRRAHPEWESGGGGLVSTITDYARFAQMLLNRGELDGKRYISLAAFKDMTSDHIGPGSGVGRDYWYFPGDGFGYGYGIAMRTDPGIAKPPPPGLIGELKWDSGSGTYFGVDPTLDMVYVMMEQTQNERQRILPVFKKLVYDAFTPD